MTLRGDRATRDGTRAGMRRQRRWARWRRRARARQQLGHLRDVLIRAHGMASGRHVQSPELRLARIAAMLDATINADPVMRGFLGRGGPQASRDLLRGGHLE